MSDTEAEIERKRKRDYFAAFAMQAIINRSTIRDESAFVRITRLIIGRRATTWCGVWWSTPRPEHVALAAYAHADAMMSASDRA